MGCSCGKKHHGHKKHDHKKPHHDDKSSWLRDLILDSCDSKHRGLLEGLIFGRHHDCDCHDHKPKPDPVPVKCEGCACSILAEAMEGDVFRILPEGEDEFLSLGAADPIATDFQFVEFDDETCCATFLFSAPGPVGGPNVIRDLVIDCRCICGLSQVVTPPPPPGTGV